MSRDRLCIQFGDNAALVDCDSQALCRSLRQHFRHCLGNTASVVATFEVTSDEGLEVQLRRDDAVLYRGRESPYLIQHLIHALTTALTDHCQEHMVFHAAGLACGERGLILFGGSGSGKSTLAAWLTASGFDFLTDEVVAVPYDLGEMIGLARPIGLKAGSAFVWQHWLDATTLKSLTHFSDGSVLLDPELLRRGCVRESAPPQILLFPRYAADEPFLVEQLSPAMALFRMMKRSVDARHLHSQWFAAASALAGHTSAYSLTYADVREAAAWIGQVCSLPRQS
jgi:hypothetical protein